MLEQHISAACVVEFRFTNHALAYNHEVWTPFLPCGNVEAHQTRIVQSPVCPTVKCSECCMCIIAFMQHLNKKEMASCLHLTPDWKSSMTRPGSGLLSWSDKPSYVIHTLAATSLAAHV